MEFPELGDHCAVTTCSQLDFLPFRCDACGKTFCKDHREYEKHNCEQAYSKDITVPVCPLCNQPVPTKRGGDPNVSVDEHIANDCQSDKAKKAYSNKCRYPGCKKKELVPVVCENCGKNYCFRHRLGPDHNCSISTAISRPPGRSSSSTAPQASRPPNKAPQTTFMSQSGAEMNRLRMERRQPNQQQQNTSTNYSQLQGMSEDEALAMAMAASLDQQGPQQSSSTTTKGASGYDEDEALARAVAASLQEEEKEKQRRPSHRQPQQRHQRQQQQQRKPGGEGCVIS